MNLKRFTYFQIALLVFLISSCNSSNNEYQLKEIVGAASCSSYQILDANNQSIKLPTAIEESLDCPAVIDLTEGVLTYLDGNTLRLYQIEKGIHSRLFTLHDGMDGISNPAWSVDRKKLLFVIINQNKLHGYESITRIVSLNLDEEYQVKSKRKFDKSVHFVCGGICSAEPYVDFMYKKNGIKYRINDTYSETKSYDFISLEK